MGRITKSDIAKLGEILSEDFDVDDLDAPLLKINISREQDIIVNSNLSGKNIILRVVRFVNKKNKIIDFLQAIVDINESVSNELLAFKKRIETPQVNIISVPVGSLERTIEKDNRAIVNPSWWRKRMSSIERQVCRIEIMGREVPYTASGFLVSSDIIMTNYHVIQELINNSNASELITIRFDYFSDDDGTTPQEGKTYRLYSRKWLIDSSEYSPLDALAGPTPDEPEIDHLDYALLCVRDEPGNELLNNQDLTNPVDPKTRAIPSTHHRGWIEIPGSSHELTVGSELHIFHHPDGSMLQLGLNTSSIISVAKNKTRVRYKTNTEGGSSGAPCFNQNWQLVAIHQSGDPNYEENHAALFNQGIPVSAIKKLLEKRDYFHFLHQIEPHFLCVIKYKLPIAYPYLRQLYEQIRIRVSTKVVNFLEWLEVLVINNDDPSRNTDTHVFWLIHALDRHLYYIGGHMAKENKPEHENVWPDSTPNAIRGNDEKIAPIRAAIFFRDRAIFFSARREFLRACQTKWHQLTPGHPIIQQSRECLESTQSEINDLLQFFYLYTITNPWLSEEMKSDYEIKYKHDKIKDLISDLLKLFNIINIELGVRSREDVLGRIRMPYTQLVFHLEKLNKWLIDMSEQSRSTPSI